MEPNHAGKSSTSRFSLRQVNASQRSAVPVDPGCQRCQHCWMRRQLPLSPIIGASATGQSIPGKRESTGGHVCP